MSKSTSFLLFSLFCAFTVSGCEDALRSGNQLICRSGSCSSSCDYDGTSESCDVQCNAGSTCDARCNPGQSCSFMCEGDARCDFDCSQGSCQATGGAMCSCSGNCIGTCGSGSPMMMTGDAGTGGSCIDMCGEPLDPGYAACAAACE